MKSSPWKHQKVERFWPEVKLTSMMCNRAGKQIKTRAQDTVI